MRFLATVLFSIGFLCVAWFATAQPPARKGEAAERPAQESVANRLMAFDKNKDGKLTKAEVTDERLQRAFNRADSDHDEIVTKDEIEALVAQEAALNAPGRRGEEGHDEEGHDHGPGGPGGRGGMGRMAPPQPGQVLSPMFQEMLQLSPEQRRQVEALQKDVDSKLEKILNAEQKAQIKQMRERGPRPGFEGFRKGEGEFRKKGGDEGFRKGEGEFRKKDGDEGYRKREIDA